MNRQGLWEGWKDKATLLFVLVTLGIIGFFYYHLMDNQMVGFMEDDGIYLITAKALAQGKGYTLLHLIGLPPQVKYPLVYPLILSVGWLLNPRFPENIPLLHALTTPFGLIAFGVVFYYLKCAQQFPVWLAWVVLVLMAIHPHSFLFLSQLMSEGPYLLFSVLTVFYAEKHLNRPTPRSLSVTILLSILTFYTRIVGIVLILAIGTWLFLSQQRKTALVYLAISLLCTAIVWGLRAWQFLPLFTSAHITEYVNYGQEWLTNLHQQDYLTRLLTCFSTMIQCSAEMIFPFMQSSLPALGSILLTLFFLAYYLFQATLAVRNRCFSVAGLYMAFYMGFILVWDYPGPMPRFLIVMVPWLWLYFMKPLLPFLKRQSPKTALIGLLLLGLVFSNVWVTSRAYPSLVRKQSLHLLDPHYPQLWQEYQATFDYIQNNLPANTRIGLERDVILYLYTNHPTYSLHLTHYRDERHPGIKPYLEKIRLEMAAHDVQYILAEPAVSHQLIVGPINFVPAALLSYYPGQYKLLYLSPKGLLAIFKKEAQ